MSSPTLELKIDSKVVRAGAGTGKTTELVSQICDLLKQSDERGLKNYPRLVVTTFTRKAAAELQERLIQKAIEKKQLKWIEYFQSPHILIGTIHLVLQSFLRRHAPILGFDPHFQIVDRLQSETHRKSIFFELAQQGQVVGWEQLDLTVDRLLSSISQYRKLKAMHGAVKPLSALEQKKMVQQYLSAQLADAHELVKALGAAAEDQKTKVFLDTLEPIIGSFLKDANLEKFFENLTSLGRKPNKTKTMDPGFVEDMEAMWEKIKSIRKLSEKPMFQPDYWEQFQQQGALFQEVAESFLSSEIVHKSERAWVDVDDLESWSLELIRQDPRLIDDFARLWDYWLIDEYQDTSPAQEKILQAFRQSKPYFIVGDPQQSIYLFRDADPTVFERQIESAEAQSYDVKVLAVNYRSRPGLLQFFNDFFEPLMPNYQILGPDPKWDKTNASPEATFIRVPESERRENENAAILSRIQELLAQGQSLSQIAILAKENKDLIDVARYLSQRQVPVYLHTAGSFWHKREVKDALSLLLFLINPWDDENLIQLMRSPWFWVSDHKLIAWRQAGKALWSHRQDPDFKVLVDLYAQQKTAGLLETFEKALIDRGFFHVSRLIDPSGKREANLFKLISKIRECPKNDASILELIRSQNQSLSKDFDDPDSEAVTALIPNSVNMMTVHSSKGLKFDHVILIRNDKKPNWSSRYMNQVMQADDEGQFSLSFPIGENEKLEGSILNHIRKETFAQREKQESLRLLYVALTRAVHSVTLTMQIPQKAQKAQKESWSEFFHAWQEPGEHQVANYKWRCLDAIPTPKVSAPTRETMSVKEPVRWIAKSVTPVKSVSKVLSDHSGSSTDPEQRFHVPKENLDSYFAAARGIRFHRKMEMAKFFGVDTIAEKYKSDSEFQKAVSYLKKLNNPPWLEILDSGSVEWSFQFQMSEFILEGKIDLWGFDNKGDLWIVDYKAGNPKSHETAFEQLNFYALPLQDKFPDKKIRLAALYPFSLKAYIKEL